MMAIYWRLAWKVSCPAFCTRCWKQVPQRHMAPCWAANPVPERWRSPAARDLAAAVRAANGTIERAGKGRVRITGPDGTITIQEPAGDTRRDLRRDSASQKIAEATGLKLKEAGQ